MTTEKIRHRGLSLRVRITLAFVGAALIVSALVAITTYLLAEDYLVSRRVDDGVQQSLANMRFAVEELPQLQEEAEREDLSDPPEADLVDTMHVAVAPVEIGRGGRLLDSPDELLDRFGPLPDPTENLIRVIEIKMNAKRAAVSKIDVGPKGVLISFHDDKPPNPAGVMAYVDRLGDIARLRPDSKLVVTRAWADPKARLNGALQISRGLAKAAG